MDEQKKKILIVEDEKDYLSILKASFGKAGFSVISAETGEEGLSLAEKENPDLIVIDIKLPGMDGIEMAKKMKEKGVKSAMIFLTNFGDEAHISQALEVATSDYIVKSDTSMEDIVDRVKKRLGQAE